MKYLSLDIEATSLDPEHGSILQVAGIVVNSTKALPPLKSLMSRGCVFNTYVKHNLRNLRGDYFALKMNSALIDVTQEKGFTEDVAKMSWKEFLFKHFGQDRITIAGKNVGSYDAIWLKAKGWSSPFRISVLDPGVLYFDPMNDRSVPSLSDIVDGQLGVQYKEHDAVEDAYAVALALQKHFVP